MKNYKKILALALVMALALMLTACSSKESKYEGTYISNYGSVLILRSDGECAYLNSNWQKAEEGTWWIEDDVLTVSDIEGLGYDIYARLDGSTTTALLFEADSGTRWTSGVFEKAD